MPAASARASASYKKQDGTLSLSKDMKSVQWTPVAPSGAPPSLTIGASEIANLQQTPASSAKVSVKFVVQRLGATAPENYVFAFTSPTDARAEQSAITDGVRKAIELHKAQATTQAPAPPKTADTGQSAAMAIAQAVSAAGRAEEDQYSDLRLLSDAALQKSLLDKDAQLRRKLHEAAKQKPDAITMSQFSAQFWSSRIPLLRAHAIERSQKQGTYNVLTEVKLTKNLEGKTQLNISKEQISLIFSQHPLVRRVYTEVVPRRLSEIQFWSQFFVSRLFKKLKGEKITELDSEDAILDKYLDFDTQAPSTDQFTTSHIPHIIDLEGNEQNHSQRKGNRPDWTMQPNAHEKVPILRVLNNMSEKMMVNVAPADADVDPHAPIGVDEETFNQLKLRDLQNTVNDNRIMLKISEQRRMISHARTSSFSDEATVYRSQDLEKAVKTLKNGVADGFDLEEATQDCERDGRDIRAEATKHVISTVKQRPHDTSTPVDSADTGLSSTVLDSLSMTQNTTVEFLHYFWSIFLSGDPDRAGELSKLVETLDQCLDRIKAVANAAESERNQLIDNMKRQQEELYRKTGRRRKLDLSSAKGGEVAVNTIIAPTVRAIKTASEEYRKVLQLQIAQAQVSNG